MFISLGAGSHWGNKRLRERSGRSQGATLFDRPNYNTKSASNLPAESQKMSTKSWWIKIRGTLGPNQLKTETSAGSLCPVHWACDTDSGSGEKLSGTREIGTKLRLELTQPECKFLLSAIKRQELKVHWLTRSREWLWKYVGLRLFVGGPGRSTLPEVSTHLILYCVTLEPQTSMCFIGLYVVEQHQIIHNCEAEEKG